MFLEDKTWGRWGHEIFEHGHKPGHKRRLPCPPAVHYQCCPTHLVWVGHPPRLLPPTGNSFLAFIRSCWSPRGQSKLHYITLGCALSYWVHRSFISSNITFFCKALMLHGVLHNIRILSGQEFFCLYFHDFDRAGQLWLVFQTVKSYTPEN